MLTVKIKAYTKGLVFKNNRYLRMLNEGRHWLKPGEEVAVYDMTSPFSPAEASLPLLLKYEELAAMLEVITVQNGEIAIHFEDGLFKAVLPAGRYAYWKGVKENRFVKADLGKIAVTELTDRTILSRPEVMQYLRVYNIESYEKGILFTDGVYTQVLEPGIYYFWKNSIVLTVFKADMRQQQMEMNGQEILTKDKANLRINFSLQYKVSDILVAKDNKDYDKQLYLIMQLALREQVATYTLDELLDKRDEISQLMLNNVKQKAPALGVTVTGCGIRDIILPGDMKDIMNQVLVAEKKAQANTIMRREETASTRSLLNTAKLMEENEMLFRLKEMEYVEKIADKISTISVSGGDITSQLKQIFLPGKR